MENRYINFAVNLGKLGDGAAAFTAAYGALSLADAASKAYAVIFGTTPTADKVAAILNAPSTLPGETTRADYFAYYGGDGPTGVGTKAALVGWLLSEAVKADVGDLRPGRRRLSDGARRGRAPARRPLGRLRPARLRLHGRLTLGELQRPPAGLGSAAEPAAPPITPPDRAAGGGSEVGEARRRVVVSPDEVWSPQPPADGG